MGDYKQVIVINNSLKMKKGKIAAQASHASLDASLKVLNKKSFKEWKKSGQPKIVLKSDSTEEILSLFKIAKSKKFNTAMITDAGKTQVPPGSKTALAIGPEIETELDKIISKFKLL